jgi:hypothetical protein
MLVLDNLPQDNETQTKLLTSHIVYFTSQSTLSHFFLHPVANKEELQELDRYICSCTAAEGATPALA